MSKKNKIIDLIKIEIIFENTDAVEINREHISNFSVHNLHKDYSLCSNAIVKMQVASDVFMVIKEGAFNNKTHFFQWYDDDTQCSLLNRTNEIKDITEVRLCYNDNTVESIYAPWLGDSDYSNEAQLTNVIERNGEKYLIIIINKDKDKAHEDMDNI